MRKGEREREIVWVWVWVGVGVSVSVWRILEAFWAEWKLDEERFIHSFLNWK